jgi:hypothetical protein
VSGANSNNSKLRNALSIDNSMMDPTLKKIASTVSQFVEQESNQQEEQAEGGLDSEDMEIVNQYIDQILKNNLCGLNHAHFNK